MSAIRSSHVKVTKDDWLNLAQTTLIRSGVDAVRILALGKKLKVSRSSFYWYFKSREDLLDQLLENWRRKNSQEIIERANRPSSSITHAILNVFECWVNDNLFNPKLDFAVRAWGRKSSAVALAVEQEDTKRVDALSEMYKRHGYSDDDALVRSRVLYLTQLSYFSLGIKEAMDERLRQAPLYIRCFTGVLPAGEEMSTFDEYAKTAGYSS